MSALVSRTVFAPGRVNLIGEHTDYTGGLVLPMALDLGITVSGTLGGGRIELVSDNQDDAFAHDLPVGRDLDVTSIEPTWGRYIASAAREIGFVEGFVGTVSSSLPAGGTGLSTSSALTAASLLAFGGEADRKALAQTTLDAEIAATGVLGGLMDQLTSLNGIEGHALMIDCHTLEITPIPLPEGLEVLVVHSGQERMLAGSSYNERRESCFAAQDIIGPLRLAQPADVEQIDNDMIRKRARHVVSDNHRVRDMMDAFAAQDIARSCEILRAGHRSYADDFEGSTPTIEDMVEHLEQQPGILAARLTGGGWGGSLVVFCEPGADPNVSTWWTRVRPGQGATFTESVSST